MTLSNSSIHGVEIASNLYQPISLTDSVAVFSNVEMNNIKLHADAMIHFSFSDLNADGFKMSNINQTYMVASDSKLVFKNSMFDRDSSEDPKNETDLSSIEYVRSCLVVETSTLEIQNSNMTNFFTTDSGGAVSTTNCESVKVENSYFGHNFASMGGALYLYCDED